MKRIIILLILSALFFNVSKAQGKYWVFFTDKKGVTFDPNDYFDKKAIDRRLKHNISLYDISDYPVKQQYLNEVGELADSLSHHSRWFNAVATYAGDDQIRKIKDLPYVRKVVPFPKIKMQLAGYVSDYDTTLNFKNSHILHTQTRSMGMEKFREHDIDGTGVRVAVFDGGFPGVDEIPVFQHIRDDNRILKTYDFAKNTENVYHGMSHGTMVLSNIAGKTGDIQLGLATDAEFLLARTEINTEPFSEEENWLAAMEWADKNGAQIINSSLGYVYHRYFPEEMDGKHSLVARAANMAAAKGMLVVNAAGNKGSDKEWIVIGTPADVDSVLTVAGVRPTTGYHIAFSSFGPTADLRRKPNVSAFGQVIVAGKKNLKQSFGTSFASPLVAGFAACALETNPELKAMELFREIEKSGELYPYFDYAHGYGVPQADYFFGAKDNTGKTFEFIESDDQVTVEVNKDIFKDQKYDKRFILYYNLQKPNGVLDKYYVLSVNQTDVLIINKSEVPEGTRLNVHYVGYSETFEF
ncbi:MAG: S8 family serine peptidase [Bacteroidales bacterium]|nr:S8 family serine peptidase [Bacteroidales bacterium]